MVIERENQYPVMRVSKLLLPVFSTLVIGMIYPHSSFAQSFTLDWGSSFAPAWGAPGTAGTATNIAGSGVNCTVSISISGTGTLVSPYPRVNNNTTNAADFEVQSSGDAIEIDQNLGNKTSSSITSLTFSKTIKNVQFGISDIDYPGPGTPYDYIDMVTVTGIGPSGTIFPVLTKYNPASNIFSIAGNVATGNTGAGSGNVTSLNQGSPDQDGTMFVDFGTNAISVITIQYGVPNIATVRANPRLQAIAIGNLSFLPVSGLPVSFTGFGAQVQNKQVLLNWQTGSATNSGIMQVESSKDGIQWQAVQNIAAIQITTQTKYSAIDKEPLDGISYYRLKETTNSGELYYSRIVRITISDETGIKFRTYPNPFREQFMIELNWPREELVAIRLYNTTGQLIRSQTQYLQKGFQVIPVSQLNKIKKGNYILYIEGSAFHQKISAIISHQ